MAASGEWCKLSQYLSREKRDVGSSVYHWPLKRKTPWAYLFREHWEKTLRVHSWNLKLLAADTRYPTTLFLIFQTVSYPKNSNPPKKTQQTNETKKPQTIQNKNLETKWNPNHPIRPLKKPSPNKLHGWLDGDLNSHLHLLALKLLFVPFSEQIQRTVPF